MGIPALFRWITNKYPNVTSKVHDELPQVVADQLVPVDWSKPNPNGFEMDNLYLDMNGIVHPCCHPEDRAAPASEDEMYNEIFKYLDHIMRMVRPRNMVYMAIDGVAPRAKMNQQRSRRFRAALDSFEKLKAEEEFQASKLPSQVADNVTKHFDSNCITPGTPFMEKLSSALKYYIALRMSTDPAWKYVKVVLSDASVPGEGEHKIMDFIRRQRIKPGYNPNMQHVIYGLDADLIMLTLATHEIHFRILREDVFSERKRDDRQEVDPRLQVKPFVFLHIPILREYLEFELRPADSLKFPWNLDRAIDDWVFLCFFVGNDFLPHLPSLEIREGAIDLLVEIYKRHLPCFNSYLSLDGDIDLAKVEIIMRDVGMLEDEIFKNRRNREDRQRQRRREMRQLKRSNEQGSSKLPHEVNNADEIVLQALPGTIPYDKRLEMGNKGEKETHLVKLGDKTDASDSSNRQLKTTEAGSPKSQRISPSKTAQSAETVDDSGSSLVAAKISHYLNEKDEGSEIVKSTVDGDVNGAGTVDSITAIDVRDENGMAEDTPKAEDDDDDVDDDDEVVESTVVFDLPAKPAKVENKESDSEPEDNVRLWEAGWKQRYYNNKFDVDESDEAFRSTIVKHYVTGLCWVLKYYYQGCQSWKWYFPFHYSPFASDFVKLASLDITFELASPLKPFEQLMGVLPAASRAHIPRSWHSLMTDPNSAIIDYYPAEFPVDMNGKKHAWQGVAILPFIEEKRLLDALEDVYPLLTAEEVARNSRGADMVYFTEHSHDLAQLCTQLYEAEFPSDQAAIEVAVSKRNRYPLFGSLLPDPNFVALNCKITSLFHFPETPDIPLNARLSARFFNPEPSDAHYVFPAKVLDGSRVPEKTLSYHDFQFVKSGGKSAAYNGNHEQGGRRPFLHLAHVQRMIREILGPSPPLSNGNQRAYGANFASFNVHKQSTPEYGRSRYGANGNVSNTRPKGNSVDGQRYSPYPSVRFDNGYRGSRGSSGRPSGGRSSFDKDRRHNGQQFRSDRYPGQESDSRGGRLQQTDPRHQGGYYASSAFERPTSGGRAMQSRQPSRDTGRYGGGRSSHGSSNHGGRYGSRSGGFGGHTEPSVGSAYNGHYAAKGSGFVSWSAADHAPPPNSQKFYSSNSVVPILPLPHYFPPQNQSVASSGATESTQQPPNVKLQGILRALQQATNSETPADLPVKPVVGSRRKFSKD